MYEYRPIEEAKVGDIIEATTDGVKCTKRKLYLVVNSLNTETRLAYIDDEGNTSYGLNAISTYWKLLKTKPGSEAKVGNEIMLISDEPFYTDCDFTIGDTLTIEDIEQDRLLAPMHSWKPKDCVVLCKVEAPETCAPIACDIKEDTQHPHIEYFKTLFDKGVKLQHTAARNSPGEGYINTSKGVFSGNFRFRLASHPEDCPEVGTQKYMEYWERKRQEGIKVCTYYEDGHEVGVAVNLSKCNTWKEEYRVFFKKKITKTSVPEVYTPKYKVGDKIQTEYKWYENGIVEITKIDTVSNKLIYRYRSTNGETGFDFCEAVDKKNHFYKVSLSKDATSKEKLLSQLQDDYSQTNPCSEVYLPTPSQESPFNEAYNNQLKEETMNPNKCNIKLEINGESINVGKHPSAACLKPRTDLENELKAPNMAKLFDENGKYIRKVSAKKASKVEALVDSHLQKNRFDTAIMYIQGDAITIKKSPLTKTKCKGK